MSKELKRELIRKEILSNKSLMSKTGVLKKGYKYLATKFNCTQILVKEVVAEIRQSRNRKRVNILEENVVEPLPKKTVFYNKLENNNRLVIGDLHSPFILKDYLEWCYELLRQYNCTKVTFIGDILDGHSWSYHEPDVDGYSVGDELVAAKRELKLAYKLFPDAEITLGNHDLLIARKAKTIGLSQYFIKDLGEILESPKGWNYSHEFEHDNVKYTHGTHGNAFDRAVSSRMSTCQGHLHSQAFVQYSVSERDAIFGLQVGCGIDRDKYAFEYAKPMTKKPIISAGLVLDHGTVPLIRLMPL